MAGTKEGASGPAFWLIVESRRNWEVDRSKAFRSFAVPARYRSAAHAMKPGDLIITYVSKASAFADVRRVRSSAPRQHASIGEYDRPFVWEIDTELVIALEPHSWVRAGLVVDELKLTRGKNWGPIFLTSLKRLDPADGSLLVSELDRVACSERADGTPRRRR